jgi:hypothetical protein
MSKLNKGRDCKIKKENSFTKDRTDPVVGIVLILLSIWYGIGARSLPKVHFEEVIEPNVYPLVLSAVLLLLSILLLLRGLRGKQRYLNSWVPPIEVARQIIFLFAALAVYILLFRTLGYLTSTILFMGGTLKFIDRGRSSFNVILISLLVSAISYGLFIFIFQIPVPRGILL